MLKTISLGAGVQSSTLALMAAVGEIEPPDCAIFADTGWEPAAVYRHLDWLETQLPFPVHRVSHSNLREDVFAGSSPRSASFAVVPWFTVNPDGSHGMGKRECTAQYKLEPLAQKQRALLGYAPRQRIPPGSIEIWLGITIDEAHRMKPARQAWQTNRWPLIERGMSRADCRAWIDRHGYPQPPKSSCIGCPFRGAAAWADMRDKAPEEWAEAVAADRAIRDQQPKTGQQFMHASRRPLDQVELRPESQGDLFGEECAGVCGV